MADVSLGDVIKSHIEAALAQLYTAIPAVVESYDAKERTVSATPSIQRIFQDGTSMGNMPIDNVPVIFPAGGGAEITFPMSKGDTVFLIFSMRNIQDWLVGDGSEVRPTMKRNHSVQDAVAIPGLFTRNTSREGATDGLEIVLGQSSVKVQDSKIIVESGTVELGEGATESVVLGDAFQALFNNHTHGVASLGAPTTVPTTTAAYPTPVLMGSGEKSSKVKVK